MIIRLACFLPLLCALIGCARQTTPEGGPKDLIAPRLHDSNPENNQKNFKNKTLTFNFTEPIKLKDPKEEIIITPKPPEDVQFLAKQNKVTISTKTGWKDSTTYSIAFRDGVQDITESTPTDNLRIAFSTGPVIDSLRLVGKVVDALTEKTPQKITVALHQSDTFNIFKHAPVYFTKTNKNGKFSITNLKPGEYKVYAFDDKNKNLKVETTTEAFGFFPGKITLPNSDSLTLILIMMDSRPIHLNNVRNAEKVSAIKLNKALISYSIKTPDKGIINSFGDDQSEIKFFHNIQSPDSIPITLHGTDSLQQKIDTVVYIKGGTNPGVHDPLKLETTEPAINQETGLFTTTLTFNKPISHTNMDSIFIRIDSAHTIPFTLSDLKYDTTFNKIEVQKTLDKKSFTALTLPPEFYLGAASFISIEDDSLRKHSKRISIPKPEDAATLLVEIQTTETNYEIQLLTSTYQIVQTARNVKKYTFRNLPAAEYRLRAYVDKNKNNQWDPGNVYLDIPPEPTYFYKTSNGKYQFPLRANWEVGPYLITF